MTVIVSWKNDKESRIYHRSGCIYARRIKPCNRYEMSSEQAEMKHYHECKYCSGLRGDVRVHKTAFETWSRKKKLKFEYSKDTDTLYIQTEIGFWKIYLKESIGEYLLYHRNSYSIDMTFEEAINGEFHRQSDVKSTESIEKIVDYIVAHERAKVTIMDDYRKLPKNTKRQKKYYKAAKRREQRNAIRRVDSIFAALEQAKAGMVL